MEREMNQKEDRAKRKAKAKYDMIAGIEIAEGKKVILSKRQNYPGYTIAQTVSIEDNGIGMSKEEQERIFTRFYQIDKSHSQEGSGLGLSIVKEMVEVLGWNIKAYKKEDILSIEINCL